jgi:hypothetical protein
LTVAATDTAGQLGWEARQRPRAAAAAAAAAVLTLVASLGSALLFADAPRAGLLDALTRAVQPGPAGALPSLRTPYFEFFDDRAGTVLALGVVRCAGFVAIAWVLTFLASATRARRRELPRMALYLGLSGGVLSGLSWLLSTVGSVVAVNDFLAGPRTVDEARHISEGTLIVTAQILGLPGSLGLGLGFVMVSMNAMRAGLLTRFMGVLGIICGVLVVIPIGSPLPIVQCFWLGALAALLVARWPSGLPPAWHTGRAEPWPSQQRARAARGAPAAEPSPPEAAEEPVAATDGREHPASKKRRKRKRRA